MVMIHACTRARVMARAMIYHSLGLKLGLELGNRLHKIHLIR